ncbi:nucleoside hydrolase [[Bacillus] enclensis]|uniref:Purine nucleosidase n=2 Tax=Rossellomorea TaxID=2837508 RepID=A0A0V8HJK5_9BACI|nr:nucleoside hydrolase [[Bacillus] enclensis]OAT82623.1 nucleoside hydrolase [Bacillus sp. MKU004]QTC42623.1 nucleoside hydrolase [Bacillus sp. V3]QWC24720.1 nucleoside hydrolase [Bacillus haikouensis]KSU62735.1 nucleoside hydrolase [[Bacillus] enclensis]MBH9965222.1 nucleoside hydrolase [[Bacillus] enclensis]
MKKKILLFADVGVDDIVALIYGYLSDDIELVGVVADYGNVPRTRAIQTANYLMTYVPEDKKFPIIGGAEIPMTAQEPTYYPEIHGEYGLGPIIPDKLVDTTENFFEIVNIIQQYDGELTIVNVGRLTSLATMYILYPGLMDTVKDVYVMGGAFWVPGNVTAVSEANFYSDPVAARLVMNYGNNLTIIPLNVTDYSIVTPEMVDYIDSKGRTELLKPLLDYYYAFYKKRNPDIQGSPVHDAITLMAPLFEDMFTFKELPVFIVTTEGRVNQGQSITDIRPYIKFGEDAKKHRIAFGFDYKKFYSRFMSVMTGEVFE